MSQLELATSYAVRESKERFSQYSGADVRIVCRRGVAALVDWALLASVLVVLARSFGMVTRQWIIHFALPQPYTFLPHHFLIMFWYPHVAASIGFAVICLLYFISFEGLFGWTLGKRAMALCVVDFFGGKPTLFQAFVRNCFRFLDAYPYYIPYLVGFGILITNPRRQRGGDKAAGTLVVDRNSYLRARAVLRDSAPSAGVGRRVAVS